NSRTEQCSSLIERINSASSLVSRGGTASKQPSMTDLANTIEHAASGLRTMQLRDPNLRRDRDEYTQTLARIATSARAMQSATDKHDQPAMREALAAIQAAGREESLAVERVNRECHTD
ncbi:MAG: hypothetical protein ACXVIJ_08280, partial [Thermoanaerobaculia bacterium]